MGTVVGLLVAAALIGAGVLLYWIKIGLPARLVADAEAARALSAAMTGCVGAATRSFGASGNSALEVVRVYQQAQRGTKTWVTDLATGQSWDAWFKGFRPAAGSVVLGWASQGYGDHHDRQILYVGPIHAVIDASTVRAARRHASRANTAL